MWRAASSECASCDPCMLIGVLRAKARRRRVRPCVSQSTPEPRADHVIRTCRSTEMPVSPLDHLDTASAGSASPEPVSDCPHSAPVAAPIRPPCCGTRLHSAGRRQRNSCSAPRRAPRIPWHTGRRSPATACSAVSRRDCDGNRVAAETADRRALDATRRVDRNRSCALRPY